MEAVRSEAGAIDATFCWLACAGAEATLKPGGCAGAVPANVPADVPLKRGSNISAKLVSAAFAFARRCDGGAVCALADADALADVAVAGAVAGRRSPRVPVMSASIRSPRVPDTSTGSAGAPTRLLNRVHEQANAIQINAAPASNRCGRALGAKSG